MKKMKTLGLIGGIGPESTVDYYKMIIRKFRKISGTNGYPNFFMNNINMTEMLDFVKEGKLDELTGFLASGIRQLELAGADFAALASNTPHIVFDGLQKSVNIPLVSIVEETMKYIAGQNISIAGLFGTMSTMNAGFYQSVGKRYGIEIIIPEKQAMDYINDKYFSELVAGIVRDETRKNLVRITEELKSERGIKGLILGGTELPLILSQNDFDNVKLINTSEIHVDAIVEMMLESK